MHDPAGDLALHLRRSMGHSFPSVSTLVDELIDREILEETGIVPGSSRCTPVIAENM